jgi:hypothetical protein
MKIDIFKILIIFQESKDMSIIDIAAINKNTYHRILKCRIWEEVNFNLDYQLVCLTLNIDSSLEINVLIRKWNKMNNERIQAESEHLWTLNSLNFKEIKIYIKYLKQFINQLVKIIVSFDKVVTDSVKISFWWILKIITVISDASWKTRLDNFITARAKIYHKKKFIRQVKTTYFHKSVRATAENSVKIWKLVFWAIKKNY